jgi:hypothetical protein
VLAARIIGRPQGPVRQGAQLISRPILYISGAMTAPSRNRCWRLETEPSPFPPDADRKRRAREVVAWSELAAPNKSRASQKLARRSTEESYLSNTTLGKSG